MKNFIFALVATAFLFTACSKESKVNRILDGEWKVSKIDGAALPDGVTGTMTFNRDGKGGTYTFKIMAMGITEEDSGTYELEGDTKLITKDGNETTTIDIVSYDKEKVELRDGDDSIELTK